MDRQTLSACEAVPAATPAPRGDHGVGSITVPAASEVPPMVTTTLCDPASKPPSPHFTPHPCLPAPKLTHTSDPSARWARPGGCGAEMGVPGPGRQLCAAGVFAEQQNHQSHLHPVGFLPGVHLCCVTAGDILHCVNGVFLPPEFLKQKSGWIRTT
ncbi:cilia- and flagella-associated protein 46-like [Neopelma chrysocephalum]|uniref:cilia- and flagella-associated protein 46-like n=1 Tax=Neopelma chrysocephalum TaxID=114329 RepID=UPI000FCD2C89|nr:cilia- and flagella-associated protein 46-like [Neopelma chrysocephalum]XP_027528207.1 cilia- and flagella-associated protein 46-like [Neopelma chrysocephalum]